MDDSDKGTEQEMLNLAIALSIRKPTLPIIGYCYNCNERVTGLFCDADCRDDYDRLRDERYRQG